MIINNFILYSKPNLYEQKLNCFQGKPENIKPKIILEVLNMIYNNVRCGLLDNIIYDFENNKLPLDNLNTDLDFYNGLTWNETTKIKKYYNLSLKHGINSIYHLKLVYIISEIIKKYYNNCKPCNKGLTNSKIYNI